MSEKRTFWQRVGGRKNFSGWIYAVLISVAAYIMESATFEAYAMWLAAALLGTSAIVAAEDMRRGPK